MFSVVFKLAQIFSFSKIKVFLFLASTLLWSHCLIAGTNGVGNGGDAVYCKVSEINSLNGYYALDYILTYQNNTYHKTASLQESLDHIEEQLKLKVPELYYDFKEFKEQIYNISFAKMYVWEPAPFGLIDVNDESLISRLPENCLNSGKLEIIQTIIRLFPEVSNSNKIIFKYVPSVLTELTREEGIQASFLFVHEWLWNLSQNVEMNRRIIFYLHSERFKNQNRSEVIAELRGMGLNLKGERYAYGSLQEEIDAADSGELIWLVNKIYTENIEIKKSIRLKVKHLGDTPVLNGRINILANHVLIEGLTVDFSQQRKGVIADGVTALQLKKMRLLNSYYGGVAMEFSNSSGVVEESEFVFAITAKAISLIDKSDFTIRSNQFEKVDIGVVFLDRSFGQVLDNTFSACSGTCIEVRHESFVDEIPASIRFISNKFGNSSQGIRLSSELPVYIENNIFEKIGGFAVQFEKNKSLVIKKSTFNKCVYGIYDNARPQTTPLSVSESKFVDNSYAMAIRVSSSTLLDNYFESNVSDIQDFN